MKTSKLNKTSGGKKQLGQGMTEYIIIVALIAVAAIGVYGAFGNVLKSNVSTTVGAVSGNTTTMQKGTNQMNASATAAGNDVTTTNGMDNYSSKATAQ
jgi:Flp pilus assembly pilin Flp